MLFICKSRISRISLSPKNLNFRFPFCSFANFRLPPFPFGKLWTKVVKNKTKTVHINFNFNHSWSVRKKLCAFCTTKLLDMKFPSRGTGQNFSSNTPKNFSSRSWTCDPPCLSASTRRIKRSEFYKKVLHYNNFVTLKNSQFFI